MSADPFAEYDPITEKKPKKSPSVPKGFGLVVSKLAATGSNPGCGPSIFNQPEMAKKMRWLAKYGTETGADDKNRAIQFSGRRRCGASSRSFASETF